jgi:hypothetical protein
VGRHNFCQRSTDVREQDSDWGSVERDHARTRVKGQEVAATVVKGKAGAVSVFMQRSHTAVPSPMGAHWSTGGSKPWAQRVKARKYLLALLGAKQVCG